MDFSLSMYEIQTRAYIDDPTSYRHYTYVTNYCSCLVKVLYECMMMKTERIRKEKDEF